MKVHVIFNAAAGTKKARQEAKIAFVRQAFVKAGVVASVESVEGSQLTAAARFAAQTDCDAVVGAGGDGTLNAVASALVDTPKPLGVLPCGTLNHFAQELGIPPDVPAAARVIAAGHIRRIDVGEVNGHIFLNNSSIGMYPIAVQQRDEMRRAGLKKWPAMIVASLNVFHRFPLLTVRVEMPNEDLPRTTSFVFVGNNEYGTDLFSLSKRASLVAGVLSLYTADCTTRWHFIRQLARAAVGLRSKEFHFDRLVVPKLWVDMPQSPVLVSLDGEVLSMESPLAYSSCPAALSVIAPAMFQGRPLDLPMGRHP